LWRCQVAERVRTDPRVTVMERTNLRYVQLTDLPEQQPVDLATLDLSFISLLKVLPAVCAVLAPRASLLALIKPQFEAGRDEVRLCPPALPLKQEIVIEKEKC
jgi:23S rRNA (cytidine1920-2'-O)/16S rRNA (cytidine1409-2'-O)-methyltransferase